MIIKFNKYLKLSVLLIMSVSFFLSVPKVTHAQNVGGVIITPQVIDDKAKIREIKDYEIKLRNDTDVKQTIYVFVNDFSPVNGVVKYNNSEDLNRTNSLASWIQIKRAGFELAAKTEITTPLKISVSMYAKPGDYHTFIYFIPGDNQPDAAMKLTSTNQTKLLINMTVDENIIEKAQLLNFVSQKDIYFFGNPNFAATMQNIGNIDLIPKGSIHIYDRQGREIKTLTVNEGNNTLSPNDTATYNNNWAPPHGFGKYRVRVAINYGQKSDKELSDTLYFYILPWYLVILLVVLLLGIIILATLFIFRKSYTRSIAGEEKGVIDLKNER